jgi:hypothetical protein
VEMVSISLVVEDQSYYDGYLDPIVMAIYKYYNNISMHYSIRSNLLLLLSGFDEGIQSKKLIICFFSTNTIYRKSYFINVVKHS